ncbi:M28 family peptidase [Sphingomonas sp. MG17]|uniref:M28 family peptidase n=1 Tax=Sphingomonas tagetis TaxID=2949092 RepID=A0A9X2HQ65_9SPHN|nr:M28 family peptidase [Sphingomonas tagetis]MCP3730550.1 M28 family peptidase [Sphingomonas tagetis]
MRFVLPVLLGLLCAASVSAQDRTGLPAIPIATLKEALRTLASDEFEGRAPGTPGEQKTLDYLVRHFQKAGLKPGNPNGPNGPSWFQDVPLVAVTSQNHSGLSFTGGTQPLSLKHGSDYVAVSYRPVPRTAVKDSAVVFVGYGVNAPEKGWNDYAGIDVKGKTVIILVNDPDWQSTGLDGPFGGRAMTYYGRWTYKYEEAARQGAAAALIVHQSEPAAYGWGTVQVSWSGETDIADAPGDGSKPPVSGWIQLDKARALLASGGRDFDTLVAAASRKGFKAVPLAGVKASLSFDNALRRHRSKNVIGILPGARRPGEYVLHTAHWDHLGRCEPAPDGDDICNGAVDNASGTAALIALAEANGKAGPADRSMVFIAFTAEESYLLGADHYGANPVFPLGRTVGGINMDTLIPTPAALNVVMVGRGKSDLDAYLDRALVKQGRVNSPEPTPERGSYYRSDHFSLAKRGVPMLFLKGGDDLIEGGKAAGQALAADYVRNRYHSPKDEFDPNWNWDGLAQDVQIYYAVGRELAMTTGWPNWVDGDEFRAIRDKSRTGAK